MKTKLLLLSIILNLCPFFAAAHDIEVKNSQGKTIYYNYSEDGMVLYVTYRDNYSGSYSGNIIIPEEVTYMNRIRKVAAIGNHAFQGCSRLTSITIPNSVKIIGNDAFKDCSGLTSVTLPNSVIRIGDRAFQGCLSLFSFTIPNKVSVIGISAFAGCSGLASVIIGNSVTDIGSYAFQECSLLTSITFPKGVRSIGDGAFYGCSFLTSITFPNTLTSIGESAFYGCSSLTTVTIPNSVTSIKGRAFDGCNDLSSIFLLFLNPFAIYGKNSEFRTFSLDVFNNVTLYVPAGTSHEFKLADGWEDFLFIEEDASLGIKKNNIIRNMPTKKNNIIRNMPTMIENNDVNDDDICINVDQNPSFPGGNEALMKWLSENLTYPKSAQENGIQGRVLVEFVVNKDGSIVEPKVLRRVDPALDKEALRIVKMMPKWLPGRNEGKPVRVRCTIPVTFRLI